MKVNHILLTAYVTGMFLSSIIPMDNPHESGNFLTEINPSLQNFLHLPMFVGFAFLLDRSIREVISRWAIRGLTVLAISSFMSLFLEAIQTGVPGRYASWLDMALNLAGTFLGILILSCFGRNQRVAEVTG